MEDEPIKEKRTIFERFKDMFTKKTVKKIERQSIYEKYFNPVPLAELEENCRIFNNAMSTGFFSVNEARELFEKMKGRS